MINEPKQYRVARATRGGVFEPVLMEDMLTKREASLILKYLQQERPTTAYLIQRVLSP